jgi:hypothetical protein
MSGKIFTIVLVCTLLLTVASLDCLTGRARAQRTKVPEEPFQVVDAYTAKTIPEILVIPLYSSHKGIFIPPEGPSKATVRFYLDNPFIYRTGEPFKVKQPRFFTGLPLALVFIGEGRDLKGILVIAPGYRPLWTDDLWWYPGNPSYERKLWLTPVSDNAWSLLLEEELNPFLKSAYRINDNCRMWNLPERCNLKVKYDRKERKLVRSFLQRAEKETR